MKNLFLLSLVIYISTKYAETVLLQENLTLCENYRHAVLLTDGLCSAEIGHKNSEFNIIDVTTYRHNNLEKIDSKEGRLLNNLYLYKLKTNTDFRQITKQDEPFISNLFLVISLNACFALLYFPYHLYICP